MCTLYVALLFLYEHLVDSEFWSDQYRYTWKENSNTKNKIEKNKNMFLSQVLNPKHALNP